MLSKSSYDKVKLLNTNDEVKDIMQLPTVTARQEGATELRVFLLETEKEYLKQVASRKNVTLSHLVRQLLLSWAVEQDDEKAS